MSIRAAHIIAAWPRRRASVERRDRVAVRSARGSARAGRRGRVPSLGLSPGVGADQRVGRAGREARARRHRHRDARDRLDHRREDRRVRRDRRPECAREAPRQGSRRARGRHARSRTRAEDRAAALGGARRVEPRRAARRGRGAEAPRAVRPRAEERGAGAGGARQAGRLAGDGPRAARPCSAGRPRARRGAGRAPGLRPGLRGGERSPPGGDLARRRPDRHFLRRARADQGVRGARARRRGGRARPDEGDRRLVRRLPLRPARRPARVLREPAPALHRLEGPQHRAARGRRAPGALGLRVRDRARRVGRGLHGYR